MKVGVHPIPRAAAAGIAVVLVLVALVVGLLDLFTSVWITPGTVYAVLIMGSLWVRDRRFLWGLVMLCLALLFATNAIRPDPDFHALTNRFIGSMGIVGVGLVCSALTGTWERLEAGHQFLQRQSAELRIANDQLVTHEYMLEHLLALSRSLTIELNRDDMMTLICQSLCQLMGHSSAAAIQERRGQEMVVVCHHGFGPKGPDADHIALDHSFAAMILNQARSIVIDDLTMRPALKVPQPCDGDRFVSVVAAPLRIRGKLVGALEVYNRRKQTWGDDQIAVIESLAAQTSISLEAAQLFEEIERERSRFMAIFRTLPVGVVVCDADQRHVRVNPAAAAMLNVPADANLINPGANQHWKISHAGRPMDFDDLPLFRAFREGIEIIGEELEIIFANGRRLSILASAAPIRQRDGKVVGAVSGFADVTVAKRLEQELDRRRREAEEATTRKTRFLAAVSHDIRTPANAINLLAELMCRTASNPDMADDIPQLAVELQSSASVLTNLVTDVLDLARYDTGKLELNETEFDLSAVLAGEVRQSLPLAQAKGLELNYVQPSNPILIRGDRVKIGRIIANLLGNAIKFTNEGAVTLELSQPADQGPRIVVRDTGVGIDAGNLPRIFDEFFQLRNPERDPAKGTGLGLTICKRLIDAMEGTITVQSEPAKGTTFIVSLPATSLLSRGSDVLPDQTTTFTPRSDNSSLRGMRVLLVEDHAPTRGATHQLLQCHGAQITEAVNGAQAIELARRFDPHVLLLDMMLPDMIGSDVLRRIRDNPSASLRSVIIMTGDVTDERIHEIQNLGITAFLPKPIRVVDLISILIARHTFDNGRIINSNPQDHADP
ncbi:MAG: response regulator [Phycisphaerales bacterium]|nr:response regulator [Phycisphaerales bacterium]